MPLTSIMRSVKLISLGGFKCPRGYKRIKDDMKIEIEQRKAMTATFLISLSDMKSLICRTQSSVL